MAEDKTKYTVELPENPRQGEVEKFLAARRAVGGTPHQPKYGIESDGEFVRAAVSLGWIKGLKLEDVDGMRIREVNELASPIGDWVSEALDLPGE